MALDGKTIIKEEVTDKDTYETAAAVSANRRCKATPISVANKDTTNPGSNNSSSSNSSSNPSSRTSCRTPESPECARVIAPRSPMSPQIHHPSLPPPPPQRPNRNASASPLVNGASTSPPPLPTQHTTSQVAAAAHVEQARLLGKIRKFLGSLVQLAQEVHPDASDRVRALVLSLGSGGISIEEFRIALQEAINLPLRPYVIPLLKNHISMLQREIVALARATNQTTLQYVTNNENVVMEFTGHGPSAEYSDIFVQIDTTAQNTTNGGASSLVFKRRASDTLMETHHNGIHDWSDYMQTSYQSAKRLHAHSAPLGSGSMDARVSFVGGQAAIFDYSSTGPAAQSEGSLSGLMEKANHRDERDRDLRVSASSEAQRHAARHVAAACSGLGGASSGSGLNGEEEWKNIHTMLNCISAMVDKTKRAITILQQRGVDPQQSSYSEISSAALIEIRRQTEDKVAEFKKNAEEAVNQVKRQAVIEIQRAVVTAETRAAEVMAQERLRMEKFFVEMSRNSGVERDMDNKSPSVAAGQNACWNCGRKATETCSGCNLARYCGAFCQHKDWEHHHQICGTTRTADLSSKHTSQVIPLSATLRGTVTHSPPTPSRPPITPTVGNSGSGTQQSSFAANGVGSK